MRRTPGAVRESPGMVDAASGVSCEGKRKEGGTVDEGARIECPEEEERDGRGGEGDEAGVEYNIRPSGQTSPVPPSDTPGCQSYADT
ncbi:MAG: hypothetical protein LBB48_05845 [Treponema sp.]|jgi:hypothetical protein|nr:hypothetical protein [Treponema sp.]